MNRKAYVWTVRVLMWLAAAITAALTLFLVGYVLIQGIPNLSWEFISTKPSYLKGTIGILPDILNTVYIVIATLVIVIPLGVGAAVYLTEYATNQKLVGIIEYAAEAAQQMVTEAVDAYVRQDLQLAHAVMQHDDIVDDYFSRVKAGIIGIIAENPTEGEYALDLLMIAKYFERIGDHCTNIAEWVEFSVTGIHRYCQ